MIKQIDLNCDMGELKAGQTANYDQAIMPYISSCNIACGFHSGTPSVIENTIRLAIEHGVAIGAHPSYNDWENFGRRSVNISIETLMAEIRYQVCALKSMTASFGGKLHHVKAHGALYNDMTDNDLLANAFIELIKEIDPQLIIYALAHSPIIELAKDKKVRIINEVFADRKYEQRTKLRSRVFEDAVLHKEEDILAQLSGFLAGEVQLIDGTKAPIHAASICLHSDTDGAVALSRSIYNFLKEKDVRVSAPQ